MVAGRGSTGVELSGALAELFTKVLTKDFKNLDVGRARVVLVEMTGRLLGTFSPESQAKANSELELRGAEVRLGVVIASVAPGEVHLGDGSAIAARTVAWAAAGVRANPLAMQGAEHVTRSIDRRLRGKPAKPFRYVDERVMAAIGRRSAVAELPFGIRFSGTLGWLSWLGLHLVYFIGFRNRVVALVNWAWNYLTCERGNRVIVSDPD